MVKSGGRKNKLIIAHQSLIRLIRHWKSLILNLVVHRLLKVVGSPFGHMCFMILERGSTLC